MLRKIMLGTALAVLSSQAFAAPLASGFDDSSIPACDDSCTVDSGLLSFNLNFFGTTYSNAFVSNNGYVTFGAGQTDYTPDGLGSGYSGLPIIAAFFADVDTRNALSALTTYGSGTFAGRDAFGVTWDGVGYYNTQGNKLNTFQLILTDRSDIADGDFDIYFNYDQIQWETGGADGGSNGLGGTSAAAGYNAGNGNGAGTFFELAGSRVPGSFIDGGTNPLVEGTNNGTPGQFVFNVRNGSIVVPGVPEPGTWAMMIAGFGLVGGAMRRRQKVSVTFA